MTYEEICSLVNYNEKESKLFMPNEVFEELKRNIKNTPHVAFSYTYLYLITWLYRYTKYFNVNVLLNNDKIKEILSYNPKQQTLNYLIKRNGLLDELEYTKTTKDYPVSWEYDEYSGKGITFQLHSKLDVEYHEYVPPAPKGFFLKQPVFAFKRVLIDEEGEEYEIDGTFYNTDNTHMIPFEVFLYSMSNPKIGCTGFYLYSFLNHKTDLFEYGYDTPLTKLSEDTGIAERTLDKYLGVLKEYKMIDFRHNQDYFVLGLSPEERKANTYTANSYEKFNNQPTEFKRITVLQRYDYYELLHKEAALLSPNKAELDTKELPF